MTSFSDLLPLVQVEYSLFSSLISPILQLIRWQIPEFKWLFLSRRASTYPPSSTSLSLLPVSLFPLDPTVKPHWFLLLFPAFYLIFLIFLPKKYIFSAVKKIFFWNRMVRWDINWLAALSIPPIFCAHKMIPRWLWWSTLILLLLRNPVSSILNLF